MFFRKSYELPISKDYVRHWGMAEAIRELLQNAIDSDSPFEWEWGADSLKIRSKNSRLLASTLLLGNTSKAEAGDKIGSFGEGYKIALLVLTRLGYPVKVHNGDRLWTPCFRVSRQFDAEVLCIDDEPAEVRRQGLEFEVGGLSPADMAQIADSCLHMQATVGQVHTTQYGRILRERPGRLYVGGLFVCETDLKFGYDAKPEHLTLERDRQTVSNFDLTWLAKMMWLETGLYDEIAQMVADEVKDVENLQYGSTELVREACYRLFRKEHPGAVIASSQAELDRLVKQGMTKVVMLPSLAPQVQGFAAYKAETFVRVEPPVEVLRRWLSANRREMRGAAIEAFKKELLVAAEAWAIK